MKEVSFLKGISFAHRGLHDNKKVVENTILSFQKAKEKGYAIELDIQLTKDNKIVVFHDKNVKRLTGVSLLVEDSTFSDLSQLSLLGTSSKIPTFSDVLKTVNGKVPLNIEIKKTKRYQELLELLFPLLDSYQGKFLIQSFDFRVIRFIKQKRPEYIRGLLVKEEDNSFKNWAQTLLMKSHYLSLDFISHSQKDLTKKGLQKERKQKLLFVWTIPEKDISKYQNWADGFIFEK